MRKITLAIISCALLLLASFLLLREDAEDNRSNSVDSIARQSSTSSSSSQLASSRSTQRFGVSNIDSAAEPVRTSADFDLVMSEVEQRLKEHQTDEALNELNAILLEFDNLPDEEKGRVLVGYASYFSRLRQFDDAIFFYEAALDLPGINPDNRLAILQLLARFAMNAEDWDAFLAYNDRYFAEGGVYNWIVTGHLLRAYQQLGDAESAGQAFLMHLETGLDPQFDGSDEQYNRRYGDAQSLPLEMKDSAAALELALGLVDEFDRIENWKVLADLYELQGNAMEMQNVLQTARERDFLDANGDWLVVAD